MTDNCDGNLQRLCLCGKCKEKDESGSYVNYTTYMNHTKKTTKPNPVELNYNDYFEYDNITDFPLMIENQIFQNNSEFLNQASLVNSELIELLKKANNIENERNQLSQKDKELQKQQDDLKIIIEKKLFEQKNLLIQLNNNKNFN